MLLSPWRRLWLPVVIVALSGILQLGTPMTSEWFRLEPAMVRDGQLWRLLSGHLLHLSWGHYLMNSLALLAICGLFWPWMTSRMLAGWMAVSACSTGLGVLWLEPQLGWYVGLSGALHGLLVAGALHEVLRARSGARIIGITVLLAVTLKLVWEQVHGPLPGSELAAGGAVIVDAHLYGAVGGVVASAPDWLWLFRAGRVRAPHR